MTRDQLLELAAQAADDAVDAPVDFADLALVRWRGQFPALVVEDGESGAMWDQVLVADGFECDPCTGIEYQTVVVNSADHWSAGGIILRFPGELPDSFEPVDLPRSARPRDGRVVARTFFERDLVG